MTDAELDELLGQAAPRPLPTAPIARAKALCRAEGWTVNKIDGRWRVAQRGKVYHFDRAELLAFVGMTEGNPQ